MNTKAEQYRSEIEKELKSRISYSAVITALATVLIAIAFFVFDAPVFYVLATVSTLCVIFSWFSTAVKKMQLTGFTKRINSDPGLYAETVD